MCVEANITDAVATSWLRLGNTLLSKKSRPRHTEDLYLQSCQYREEQVN
jgi:hypothetical protein